MPAECLGGGLRIMRPQRLIDCNMVEIALFDGAGLRDGDLPVVEHERIKVGHEVREQGIAGAAIDRDVELPVADQEMHRISHGLLLDRQGLLEARKRVVIDAQRGFGRDGPLDQETRLVNGLEIVGVDRARTRDADLQRVDLAADDPRPGALADGDHAHRRQRLDGAAHRLAADVKERGELPLAWKLVANLKNARRDQRRKLVADPLAHGPTTDLRFEMRGLCKDLLRRCA